jgi:ketosteroid isomerase-like protein
VAAKNDASYDLSGARASCAIIKRRVWRVSRRIHVTLVLVCVACSQETQQKPPTGSSSSATDTDAIRQMYPAFVAAKLARDVEKELSFVTDDAVYTPPGIPDVAGKAALRAWWTSREAADSLEVFDLDPGEIVVAGDLAYSRGTSTSRFRNRRTGQISNQAVRHLDILRRQPNGHWLISRHIRNSSEPTPQ